MSKSRENVEVEKIIFSSGAAFSSEEMALNFPFLLDHIKLDDADFKQILDFLEKRSEAGELSQEFSLLINKLYSIKKLSELG